MTRTIFTLTLTVAAAVIGLTESASAQCHSFGFGHCGPDTFER